MIHNHLSRVSQKAFGNEHASKPYHKESDSLRPSLCHSPHARRVDRRYAVSGAYLGEIHFGLNAFQATLKQPIDEVASWLSYCRKSDCLLDIRFQYVG